MHLDVAMHVAFAVEVLESLEQLPDDDGDGRLLDRAQRTNLCQQGERYVAMDRSQQTKAGDAQCVRCVPHRELSHRRGTPTEVA